MKIGLSRRETLALPFGELLDFIAIQQIKNEGAKRKLTIEDNENEFMRLLSFK
jgi:hypothetical protein|nr:MAG TPA: hypothetical protein [Caudoviricetes sp.]